MAAATVTAGDPGGFGFQLRWPDERSQEAFSFEGHAPTAAEATRGKLIVWVGGRMVWGFERERSIKGISWTWIELVEHLARVWPYIEWEENYPLDLAPITPDTLPAVAAQTLTAHPEPVRSDLEQSVWDFRDAHDLAFGLPGLQLPSLWILAQGKKAWVSSPVKTRLLPKEDVFAALNALAAAILERAKASRDPRAEAAQNAWNNRAQQGNEELAAIYTGASVEDLKQVAGRQPFWKTFEVPTAGQFEPNEVLCAARGLRGAVTPGDLRSVLDRIRGTKRVATPELDRLSADSESVLAEVADEKPAEQGKKLAMWLRGQLDLGTKPILVSTILKMLRVRVTTFNFGASHVDAISFWGKRHGPAVLVNELGTHAQTAPGANATLAHELCHLIADRNDALPFGEVFTRASLPVESRARAFAAELLVPSTVVVDAFAGSRSPDRVLKKLSRKFNASAEVIAWQARNSGAPLDKTARTFLRGKVSRPEVF